MDWEKDDIATEIDTISKVNTHFEKLRNVPRNVLVHFVKRRLSSITTF